MPRWLGGGAEAGHGVLADGEPQGSEHVFALEVVLDEGEPPRLLIVGVGAVYGPDGARGLEDGERPPTLLQGHASALVEEGLLAEVVTEQDRLAKVARQVG
ncbi:MAG: hypothetical protein ABIK79_14100 [Chloroflexota bacterium]